ncbi:tetratricopeptide repeat protein [Luteimonas sp. MJ174]|uniref:tetratricopeptide repeat protein n=1 Tax=Luteimonas sp. MJ174 TaxID=3129237 RepID=UPI0031B9F85C
MAFAMVVATAYWPGVRGDFLFDDFANLPALGRYGGVRDAETLLYYLTSGIADPTGRPVSMLSFLIDATDWPADPYPFKRTNILLHALNGVLLHGVLSALGRRVSADSVHIRSAALLATALWLSHPLWASTVLYIVQRHAMLAAFFVFAGMRAWIASRDAFDAGRPGPGWAWAILAVPVCGLLAGLSKANGFLLPLLLLVLQATVLRMPAGESRPARRSRLLLAMTPALAVVAGLAVLGWEASGGNAQRSFGFGERLLSQPRALLEYLHQLLVPGLDNTGVFADGFVASTGVLTPWDTLPALMLVASIAVAGWLLRRKWPVGACALLFFLAGHALESGPVMLELYFEHRNYLPAAFLFWPIAWWLCAPGRHRRLRIAAGVTAALLFLLLTFAQANLWANPLALARDWAARNPDSSRAQAYAAQQETAHGHAALAEQRLINNLTRTPDEPQFALNLLNLRCQAGTVTERDVANAVNAVRHQGVGLDMTNQWLAAVLAPRSAHPCAGLPDEAHAGLLDAATSSPGDDRERQARSAQLAGLRALRNGRCGDAQQAFARRLEIQPRPEATQTHIELLATYCSPALALMHLEHYLAAGTPIITASSPALRLRDRLMQESWTEHWRELRGVLREQSPSNTGRPQT